MTDEPKVSEWNPIRLGVAIPSDRLGNVATRALLHVHQCPLVESMVFTEFSISALTLAHNHCWTWALNAYRSGVISHLLLMHSDVRPLMPHWAEVLVTEMQRSHADVLGAFIPIKNPLGLTSTAIDTDRWNPQRLTLVQAKYLPLTWTSPRLLLNTGFLLIDLARCVNEELCFTVNDTIREVRGKFIPYHEPEDWNFTRQCHKRGLRVFVTRAIGIEHAGIAIYPNAPAWGTTSIDEDSVRSNYPVLVIDADGERYRFDPDKCEAPMLENGEAATA